MRVVTRQYIWYHSKDGDAMRRCNGHASQMWLPIYELKARELRTPPMLHQECGTFMLLYLIIYLPDSEAGAW